MSPEIIDLAPSSPIELSLKQIIDKINQIRIRLIQVINKLFKINNEL